jgi:predicted phage terminase large subunit-like protein
MPTLTPEEYNLISRLDLSTFHHRAFRELNPQTRFLSNWHNELIAGKLQACWEGKIDRLIITVPPRSGKSLLASVSLVAFGLGHNPSAEFICASYGQDLANKHALDCRRVMSARWYQELFSSTRLSPEKQSVNEFQTTENGFRLSTSVGGVMTGRGGDFLIIDDPLKPDEALSDVRRSDVNGWYDHTLYSRLNDKVKGRIIIIMQRLHQDDLVGHVLEQEGWDLVKLPAIAEQDEEHRIEAPLRSYSFRRKAGEALHPEREPLAVLDHLRSTIGEYNFAGQYQQQPSPLGGGMVKRNWFRFYEPGSEPVKFESILQSWDTANKSTELSDYSACTTWGWKSSKFYLLNVHRQRLDYPYLKRAVRDLAEEYRPRNILIEDKASGTQLIQELRVEGFLQVTPYEPTMDKIMRMNSVTSIIESGRVYLPTEATWLQLYLDELQGFPKTKYDDQADSTSQALDWAKVNSPVYAVAEYYRREELREKYNLPKEYRFVECDEDGEMIAEHRTNRQQIRWNGLDWISCTTEERIVRGPCHPIQHYPASHKTCPSCGATCIVRLGGVQRCNQCTEEWHTYR